jgi:hypothetical protein
VCRSTFGDFAEDQWRAAVNIFYQNRRFCEMKKTEDEVCVAGTPQEITLLENAAEVYAEAGSPADVETCNLLIEIAQGN